MNDDLNTVFDGYRPAMGDNEEYMERLQKKMQLMATVKQQNDELHRRYRRGMVVAFAIGAVLGVASVMFMFFHPLPKPLPDITPVALFIRQSRPILMALSVAGLSILTAHLAATTDWQKAYK